MTLSKNKHLTKEDIIKNGSFFTPEEIVNIAHSWLKNIIKKDDIIIDFGVGYGAFITKFVDLTPNLIATDIDELSLAFLEQNFPHIKTIEENSLLNIDRAKYGLTIDQRLISVGNPPYNDVTSQYKKGEKGEHLFDASVKSRDLGISFMKMYSLLESEYICILHPLSYLIKKANFNSLDFFNHNYKLQKGLIFSSQLFESIKKTNLEFPVVLALYKRNFIEPPMSFNDISKFEFDILNSKDTFKLSNFITIDGIVQKYPNKNKKDSDLQFYTLRDINALKRNRTFVKNMNNGLTVDYENLYQYAWIDFFKENFKPAEHYIYGNLSPLYAKQIENNEIKKQLINYIYFNNEIVNNYINNNEDYKQNILNYYKIKDFTDEYPDLNTILKSII